MCCFSRPVQSVRNTHIFARGLVGESQQIVYSMGLHAAHDVAMILPIPAKRGTGEKAVRFINLEDYPDYFSDMERGFPSPPPSRQAAAPERTRNTLTELAVAQVGNFDASYVPSTKDFSRLDKQFRLPTDTWDQVPQYHNYGFVVFKFRKGNQEIHPMAFEFPRNYPNRIFFPTVHIHDQTIAKEAEFDHTLYCQLPADDVMMLHGWRESRQPAGMFMNEAKSNNTIDPMIHIHRSEVTGMQLNSDLWI
tara:strand:+ start:90 stop:836 length:747 start_codon:yes stop_codon:yes gene_type:complete